MEPENELLEEEIPIKNPSFSGSMLIFGGCRQIYSRWILVMGSYIPHVHWVEVTQYFFIPSIPKPPGFFCIAQLVFVFPWSSDPSQVLNGIGCKSLSTNNQKKSAMAISIFQIISRSSTATKKTPKSKNKEHYSST